MTTVAPSDTFLLGGNLPVHRLGYGAMQLTGPGIWGAPRDWDRLNSSRRQRVGEIGRADTAQFAGAAASVPTEEPDAPGGKKKSGDAWRHRT